MRWRNCSSATKSKVRVDAVLVLLARFHCFVRTVGVHNAFVNGLLRAAHESTTPVSPIRIKRPFVVQDQAHQQSQQQNQQPAPPGQAERVAVPIKSFNVRDTRRRNQDVVFNLDTPPLRTLKRRMLTTARQMRLRDVTNEAVELLYRAAEHRLTELLRRSRAAPQRLAPAMPSVHVREPPTAGDDAATASTSQRRATAEPKSETALPIDAEWMYPSILAAGEQEWFPPPRPVTRARSNATVRCAGIVAPLDLVRALRLHAPLVAEDAAVNRERAALVPLGA
jgi:hypothetical protein